MTTELNLSFTGSDQVQVQFNRADSATLPFVSPVTEKDREDIRWYLEVYGAHSLGDPDDKEARRIKLRLPEIGKALFDAVFGNRAAQRVFNEFQDCEGQARLLTVSAEHPSILSLPWELLHDPAAGGVFLFHENPRISVRRRLPGASGGRPPFPVASKDRLNILFVVSRPEGSSFLDPRADAGAVMDALDAHGADRFTWEFLRPPTIDALTERLEDRDRPPVDILHFDGHGVFDRHGGLPERVAKKDRTREPFEEDGVKNKATGAPRESPPGTGYLLFETPEGKLDFASADRLGTNLHRQKVALVILSACQTAALGDADEPVGCVAARLTGAGIPAVLAMTHSVLVATTRTLFGQFYRHLTRGEGIGEALDNARRYLANYPEKYEVQRGPERVMLRLDDWFLPALYQGGDDVPLLAPSSRHSPSAAAGADGTRSVPATVSGRLRPRHEAGFFGRRRELWQIERWFAGPTRRISISGFGGQGKTELALEAGRWLLRAGMFRRAVFVDYSQVQAEDALRVAVSYVGSVLDRTLSDANEAARALAETPTLVILDNLEAVTAGPLRELLDGAFGWSLADGSRVLLTSRLPDFHHPQYRVAGTFEHRRIVLDGLGSKQGPDDALEWFAALGKLPPPPEAPPPDRRAVIELFDRVKFHPLSIRVLAHELKTRLPAELGERLGELLAAAAADASAAATDEDTPAELLASLRLSLDRLDEEARRVLPRLGVFQGGAFEDDLLAITGLGEGAENVWPGLRRQLEAAALVEAESVPGVVAPFLRFHPTLAPMLWAQLDAAEQARLTETHRRRYYAVSAYLYAEDRKSPDEARAIAWRELPNLLYAVHRALDAGDPDAVTFVDTLTRFLNVFGLTRDAERLGRRGEQAGGQPGSEAWYLAQSNKGERLLESGRVTEAAEVFSAILEALGGQSTYERAATLGRLGRCYAAGGRPNLAEACHREGIALTELLEQSDGVKRHRGILHTELADVLAEQGKFAEAREQYEAGLRFKAELDDVRAQGVTLGQLGSLALREGKVDEALGRYREALALFQRLREPESEAVLWHQLGMVFQQAREWDEAERHYRESARLKEAHEMIGGPNGAVTTWNQLAVVSAGAGKPEAAETWYRKAIKELRSAREQSDLWRPLSNLADLVRTRPGRLAEARGLAEEALAIKKTLHPGAAEIWKTYDILAEIADQEAGAATEDRRKAELQQQGAQYRRDAREAKRNFAGTRHEVRRHLLVILGTVAAVHQLEPRTKFEETLSAMERHGWTNLVAVIRRILSGERGVEALCAGLDLEGSMIVETILAALADPSTLADLLPPDSAAGREG